MKKLPSQAGLFRTRGQSDSGKVSFIELFFDLVFVFAVTQLSHSLLDNLTIGGLIQLVLLSMAVWWVWIFTAWVINWLNPETLPVRLMLLALMLLGLVMSASIPEAFGASGLYFAAAYTLFQVGRTAFTVWMFRRGQKELRINFIRILLWLSLSGIFWIAGGAAEDTSRLALWIAALLIEYAAPSLGFWVPRLGRTPTAVWDVEGSHMAERCGLFIIIALGESILLTGATFSGLAWTTLTMAAFACAFLITAALWWIYFDAAAKTGHHYIAHSSDPGRVARSAYTYTHLLLVTGIIVTAVAAELLLAHPTGHTDPVAAAVMLGGPGLFLLGSALFMHNVVGAVPSPYLSGFLVLLLLFPFAGMLSPLLLSVLAAVVLIVVCVWGHAFSERLCRVKSSTVNKQADTSVM
ncbi:low temperature requirement A [Paenibacillus mucilaginosus 3016]|uniref:Low temperature requirement A n=1 Tax=Paenibacillus mucilaginosus 3016 TaxID=1116391 RepID=H6NKV7_9BACL|nr:low temperature requirement protein A [Paenibacillus mucilaginosus]AFC29263.1 low temperature requirement A [Paenibacillus mucilaginosus 3016]WFA17989.1 low temperature requirement protein A [Paenibacillus mucilaginosus]